jgi:Holliday junction DNA helicase RuvB
MIIERSSTILKIKTDEPGALEIARRSRGTPRIANNLLAWTRDYAQVKADNFISKEVARNALEMNGIDDDGLDEWDNRILETILYKFSGGPVGLKSIAVAIGEEEGTLEDVYEPYLIQEGYLMRTPKGRIATDRARERFGLPKLQEGADANKPAHPDLF